MAFWRSSASRAAVPAEGLRLDQTPPPGAVTSVAAAGVGLPDPMQASPGEMPFLDHLEELRWRILKALGGVAVCVGVCLFFAQQIVDGLLMAPTRTSFFMYDVLSIGAVDVTLQNRTITGQFFAYFGTVLATGLVIGSPVVVYQLWKFIEPGLYRHERRSLRFASLFATAFFVAGISFGYLVLSPIALQFFAQFSVSESIVNEFDISKYFGMLLTWSFGTGLLFELPVVVSILAQLGILTEAMLKTGRRFAIVIILILAGLFTPPDPLSQIILAVPMLLLYELSVVLTRVIERRRLRTLAEEAAREAAEAAARGEAPPPAPSLPAPAPAEPPPTSTEHSVAGAVAGALAGAVAGAAAGLEAARAEDAAHDRDSAGDADAAGDAGTPAPDADVPPASPSV